MKTKMTFTKVNLETDYNMINPDKGERMGNYELQKQIVEKWEQTDKREIGSGNIYPQLYIDVKKGKGSFMEWSKGYYDKNLYNISNLISSPLLMYRLCCLFFVAPNVYNGYKTIWEYNLIHKETGKHISFSEWKGCCGFWLPEGDHSKLTDPFKKDLVELVMFLCSDQIAHPYDGCTAGQVA